MDRRRSLIMGVVGSSISVNSIPNNEIWYTSSDGNVVAPYDTNVFGSNIVSNTYVNGQGIISFDGPVTSIGDYAFNQCENLTSVYIPGSVTTIGIRALWNCTSLTSVTIPDSVTTIGISAFEDCDSLTSITIGDSVTAIGDYTFAYCDSLTSVYCKATTPPSLGGNVFLYNVSSRRIYVPTNSVGAYKSATNWSKYASYIVGYNF